MGNPEPDPPRSRPAASNSVDPFYQAQHGYAENTEFKAALPSSIAAPESVDAWSHLRLLDLLSPILLLDPGARWLTVGDGRFGSDAYFIQGLGGNVTASNLSTSNLAIAKEQGLIRDYSQQNAEAMTFADATFDYVLCKESYHHFPRPPVAFYEMLRVARKGVILIEPQQAGWRPLASVKKAVKFFLRKDAFQDYETSGNYIYRLNVHEVRKMLLALDLPTLAYQRVNTMYHRPWAVQTAAIRFLGYLLTRAGIGAQTLASGLGLMDYGVACVAAFREVPPPELQQALSKKGFRVELLPRNPYRG